QVIKALTPLAEQYKYTTALKSITQGRASFKRRFKEYAPVPSEVQKGLATQHAD
ncbi:MAG: hypothetical protein KKE82_07210, partial [Proteobacteria bacterium]|nr:hypothetical protein [Pseudomonadota bacterium]MBU1546535.1 hypothetical protein [Pseudomonadota bacterium]